MASSRTCALLLRAVTLGGMTAAAWLLSGAIASASPADEAPVDITPQVEIPSQTPDLLADPAGWAVSLVKSTLATESSEAPDQVDAPKGTEPEDDGPALDLSGGTSSAGERSGMVSNQAPEHVIAAKMQANAARKAAKQAAAAPPPAPAPAPTPPPVVQPKPTPPIQVTFAVTEPVDTDADWNVPNPSSPSHTPQPAPAVTAPSASSGHQDNSGGTRGVLAVLPSHSALFPPTTWTVEERTDGRSPGSLPGLPSTSPD